MNSLERYLGVIRGERVDLLPRIPILMQFAAEYIGSNYGEFASDYRVLVEANRRCIKDFGFDQLSAISDNYRETHGFGGGIEYRPDTGPKCIPPLTDSKDLSLLIPPDPYRSERMFDRVLAIRAFRDQCAGQYSIMGWVEGPAAEAADVRGVGNFLIDLIDDEPFVCELMDICLEAGIHFALAQVEAGADTIGIGDSIASQISPEMYERLVQPREKTLVQAIRKTGALVKLHICGNITHLLPGIANLGISIVDVDHMVDLTTVRRSLPESTVISGNINPVEGVMRGTPAVIRERIQSIYQEVGNPYMVNAGCEIPSRTPKENLQALCMPIEYRP